VALQVVLAEDDQEQRLPPAVVVGRLVEHDGDGALDVVEGDRRGVKGGGDLEDRRRGLGGRGDRED
jgi:hypothetical protein